MKTYRINRLNRLNRLNQKAQRFNMIYGWILPNGEVVDIPMYEHADYVKDNPGKFNIPTNINMSGLMDHEAYIMAFQAGAIRYSYCRKLNLDCKLESLYKLFEAVHKVYRRSGNIGGVYINLRGDNGETIRDINVDRFDELNEYASSEGMKREARGVKTGWILSNGEIIEFEEYIEHWEYLERNPLKFNIDLEEIGDINNVDDIEILYKKAYESGAIRFASSFDGTLNIECTRDALSNIEVIHRLYNRLGCNNGLYINIGGINTRINDISDLYNYASKIDKVIKVANSTRGIKVGWIAPSGEVCEITDSKAHWNYLLNNPDKFGIKMDVRWMDNGVDSLYWQAFKNGAIRYHSCADGILNIQCIRSGLRDKASDIHRLYKKLGCNNGLYVSIINVEGERIEEEMRIDDISDLYSYAGSISSVKIYRIGRYELWHQFWILANGEIRDLGGGMHIDYIKHHIGEFGIDEDMVIGKEFSSIPYYRYAFKSGAIRVVITDREFTINCNRGALRKHINVLHSLYKKYCNNVRIILEFNEGDGYIDAVDIRDIGELYNYASSVKIYRISMEMRELEEKPLTGDGQVELTHLINLLHEIEYKNKMLQGGGNFIHPKRKVNIELRLKQYAWLYFKYIKAFTIECFNMWNKLHPTESGDKWADMIIDSFRESYGSDEDVINHFVDNDNKLEWNGLMYDLTEAPINKESVREYLKQEDEENLLEDIRGYLEYIGKDVDSANLDMVDDDRFIDYFIENMSVELHRVFIDMNSIRGLISERVYRDYMITWGGTIEDIKRNIKDAIDRMDGIGEDSSISEMTMAISLALNVQHASGTVLIDMGDMAYDQYIIGDINSRYLDLLSELDVSEWESEFHKEFGI